MNLYCILYNISISIINITIHRIINVIIVMAIMLFDHFLRFQLFVVVIISDNEGDVFFLPPRDVGDNYRVVDGTVYRLMNRR